MRLGGAFLLGLFACGGVSPAPDAIAGSEPPIVTDGERTRATAIAAAAWTHLERREWSAARRVAATALAIDPRAARALAVIGACHMQDAVSESPPRLQAWHEAEGRLRLAHRLAPTDAEIALLLAGLLERDGHLTAAAAALDPALAASPRHEASLRVASRLHYELGEERTAVALLSRLLELAPQDQEAWYRFAQCELRLADTDRRENAQSTEVVVRLRRAAAAFAAYRDLVPNDAEGWAGEAQARLLIARAESTASAGPALDRVAELLREATLRSASPDLEFNLGVVHEERGDTTAAHASYTRALERDPEHLPTLLNLTASLAAGGRVAEAQALARRALALSPSAAERRQLQAFLDK